jgi:predicted nucleic acid-binding protein
VTNKSIKRIYLDVCVLSRPFDDQSYLRIRLETEATNLILSRVENKEYELVVSPAHWEEISAISDIFERIDIEERLRALGSASSVNMTTTRERAEELYRLKFGVADAAHVAFAEECGAEFISCDDALIKKCLSNGIQVWCGNPVAFCEKERFR